MSGKIQPFLRCALWLAPAVLFIGCPATLQRGDTQKDWALTLRELGIQPVFPPREDVQVGDVYLRRGAQNDPALIESKGYVPIDLWVASVTTATAVSEFYGSRPSFPATKTDTARRGGAVAAPGAGDSRSPAAPIATDGATPASPTGVSGAGAEASSSTGGIIRVPQRAADGDIFGDRSRRSLRQVAFPDFASMIIQAGNLQGLVPVEALTVAFGADWKSTQQVDVKVPVAESYGLPAAVLLGLATEEKDGKIHVNATTTGLSPLRLGLLLAGLTDTGSSTSRDGYLYIDVISEVFYTRVIDIAISKTSDFGASVAVKTIDTAAQNAVNNALQGAGATPSGTTATGTTPPGTPPAATGAPPPASGTASKIQESPVRSLSPQERANELNRSLDAIERQSQIGGGARFLAVSDSSIQMRRTYERPIAIGFRAIGLKIDPNTGEVVGAAAVNRSPLAQTTAGSASEALSQAVMASCTELVDSQQGVETMEQGGKLTISVTLKQGKTLEDVKNRIREQLTEIYQKAQELTPKPITEVNANYLRLFKAGKFQVEAVTN